MSYINNKNTPSYVRPPRTRKFVQCYCPSCKGKLVDPRTKKSHYAKKDRIVPQREAIRNSESKNQPIDPIPPLGEFMETNDDDDPQENYQFLVRKMLPVFQKNIKSTISVPEENEQNSDDDTLGYSSDDSELNFDAPELELEDDLKIADVSSNSPDITPKFTDCVFQEFPNHPMSNKREICGNPLYKLVPTKNGSFHNSHRKIEIELMKIIQHNALLDELTSHADQNPHLQEVLIILKPRDSVGSLSMYDEYTDEDYKAFRLLSTTIEEGAAFGFEIFPGSFLGPSKKDVLLTQDIYLLLTEFYCNVYEKDFVALSHIHNAPEHSIPVLPKVN
ncbi:15054_t:CDS:2, partial [Rhizophagus irregularis]